MPLLRKMKITTNPNIQRFGADAIHYKMDGDKNVFVLGEGDQRKELEKLIIDSKVNETFKLIGFCE